MSNQQYVARPGAGVSVACANHIRFERNVFAHMGATGLDFNYGTHDDMVIGNVFTDIAGIGISIAKFTQDSATEYHVAYNPSGIKNAAFLIPFGIIIYIRLPQRCMVLAALLAAIPEW